MGRPLLIVEEQGGWVVDVVGDFVVFASQGKEKKETKGTGNEGREVNKKVAVTGWPDRRMEGREISEGRRRR